MGGESASLLDLIEALSLELPDFEDAVQAVSVLEMSADALVTRNGTDFRDLSIPIRSPGAILASGLPSPR